jgi:hypothetical protein
VKGLKITQNILDSRSPWKWEVVEGLNTIVRFFRTYEFAAVSQL